MTRLERRLAQTMQILMLIAVSCLHCLDATICMNFQLTICEQQMRILLLSAQSDQPHCCLLLKYLYLIYINCFVSSGFQVGVYLCILGIFNPKYLVRKQQWFRSDLRCAVSLGHLPFAQVENLPEEFNDLTKNYITSLQFI